jgi:hypothetical protein
MGTTRFFAAGERLTDIPDENSHNPSAAPGKQAHVCMVCCPTFFLLLEASRLMSFGGYFQTVADVDSYQKRKTKAI